MKTKHPHTATIRTDYDENGSTLWVRFGDDDGFIGHLIEDDDLETFVGALLMHLGVEVTYAEPNHYAALLEDPTAV
jgi:hypothetical protein